MAKYYTTHKINSIYSEPKGIIAFDFYKSGAFDGFGDCSYYIPKVGTRTYAKVQFSKDVFSEREKYICEFISFIHAEEFDTLTKQEFAFIETEDFAYICKFLNGNSFKFNHNYTSIEIERKYDNFTINDEGRYGGSGNLDNVESIWNYKTEKYEDYYIGKISLSHYESSIKIPVVKPSIGRVEIKEIFSNVNLFKCLCFCLKINLLGDYLYPELCSGATWLSDFEAYNHNFYHMIKKFSYYNII